MPDEYAERSSRRHDGERGDRHRSSRHEDRGDRDYRDRYSRRGEDERRSSRYERDGGGREGREGREPRGYEDGHKKPSRHDEERPSRRREDDRRGERPDRGERPERRGGGGGGGREGRGKREAATPERRSPTPEGAVPLSQRKRKASGWDVHAPGYEQYSAMQAKQTGLFNLPGANRTQIPPILGIAGLPAPIPVQSFGMGIGGNPNLSRQSRRLYIGSINQDVTEQNLADFFNTKMPEMGIGTGGPGNPVLAVQCNYEKNYAFVEFRSAEDATSAMAFDGIMFVNGPLKIRRPKDYGGDMANIAAHVPGVVSTNVPDSINKIFVGGLPTHLTEDQVQELLASFGELKAFNLVRENGNGASKGFAFCEYVDPNVTDLAIQSLNGMEVGDRYLVVQRASVGARPSDMPEIPGEIPRPIMPAGETDTSNARILLMLNMVTSEDLIDDQDYGDLYDDIKEECSNFGPVEDLKIPRPAKRDKAKWGSSDDTTRIDEAAGVGRVYVKYGRPEHAAAALKSLAGRSFAGRSIIATVLSEDSQTTPPLNIIFAPEPEAPPPLPTS